MVRIILIILLWFIIGWIAGIASVTITQGAGELVITRDEDNVDYMFLALSKEPEKVKKSGHVLLKVVKVYRREIGEE